MKKALEDENKVKTYKVKKGTKYFVAPEGMGEVASKEFKNLMSYYRKEKIEIKEIDISLIVLFCESFERYTKAYKSWRETYNESYENDSKNVLKSLKENLDSMVKIAPLICLSLKDRLDKSEKKEAKKGSKVNKPTDINSFLNIASSKRKEAA